ncbi:MAG: hypothetical protein FWG11_07595 [Promicromonosporaceae bacterium]|nr:hypothetical protein [Promicromonosporaceae bacterium]
MIDALAAREYVEPGHPAAYVVRVRAKEKPNDQRAFMGYATSYGTRNDEKTRRDALRCWWPVRDPGQYDDHLLVASLAGFVVAVYRITGFKPHPIDTRIAFEVQEIPRHDKKHPDTIDAAWFDNHRVERWRGALSGPYVAGNNPGAKQ